MENAFYIVACRFHVREKTDCLLQDISGKQTGWKPD